MVFHCRCLSFTFKEEEEQEEEEVEEEEEEEIGYETSTQVQSSSTQTFRTALSSFNPDSQQPSELIVFSNDLKVFTFSELKAATNNFSLSVKIGEGGFWSVYAGVITNPLDSTKRLNVTVKRLSREGGLQGQREWLMEVNVLGVVDHPNLVKLLGYCAKDDEIEIERLLVYEYLPNRSVEDHLSTRSEATLSWIMRLKVAQDVARGLTYLHEQVDFQIIFRRLKSCNILLDDQWNAKLSNFGLAHLGAEHVSTTVIGTIGYAEPEFIRTWRLMSKVDVWSYGVFLYELITGRRPVDWTRPINEQNLLEWVKPYVVSNRLRKIIDPRLKGNCSLKSAIKLAIIANRCVSMDPKSRPKMSEALEMVNQVITMVPLSQTPRLNSLVPTVAIEPKMAHAKKTNEKMKNEGERECSEVQRKDSACFLRISCCCVS